MARRTKLTVLGVAVAVVAMGAFAYWYRGALAEPMTCGYCARTINPKAGVIAEIGGVRKHVCCAHCAVSEARIEHKPLRLVAATDYYTQARIDPAQAWFVEGSRLVACEHDMGPMDESKQPAALAYDRCAPGTYAFSSQQGAEAFVRQNGGVLRRLNDLLAEVSQ